MRLSYICKRLLACLAVPAFSVVVTAADLRQTTFTGLDVGKENIEINGITWNCGDGFFSGEGMSTPDASGYASVSLTFTLNLSKLSSDFKSSGVLISAEDEGNKTQAVGLGADAYGSTTGLRGALATAVWSGGAQDSRALYTELEASNAVYTVGEDKFLVLTLTAGSGGVSLYDSAGSTLFSYSGLKSSGNDAFTSISVNSSYIANVTITNGVIAADSIGSVSSALKKLHQPITSDWEEVIDSSGYFTTTHYIYSSDKGEVKQRGDVSYTAADFTADTALIQNQGTFVWTSAAETEPANLSVSGSNRFIINASGAETRMEGLHNVSFSDMGLTTIPPSTSPNMKIEHAAIEVGADSVFSISKNTGRISFSDYACEAESTYAINGGVIWLGHRGAELNISDNAGGGGIPGHVIHPEQYQRNFRGGYLQ